MIPIARHRWVEIGPAHRAQVAATCADEALRDDIARWLALGRPLIARSRQSADPAKQQPLGLCLPRASAKRRVALSVPAAAIARAEDAAPLRSVAAVLPAASRDAVGEMIDAARSLGFEARAYGSAAWQWRTGEVYLGECSDLDLLAAPPDAAALRAWLALLGRLGAEMPMRIDGEIECPSGDGVNWRELAGGAAQVLLKSSEGARLAPATSVWEQFR